MTNRFAHEMAINVGYFGLQAWAVEEGLEAAGSYFIPEYWNDTWITDEEGNIDILGFRPDIANRFAEYAVMWPVEAALTPARWTFSAYDWAIEKALGKENDGLFGTGLESKHLSLYQDLPYTKDLFGKKHSLASGFVTLLGDRWDDVENHSTPSDASTPEAKDQQQAIDVPPDVDAAFIRNTLDPNIAKRKTEVEIAESALKTAQRDHARLKKIAGKDDSDVNITARDDAETAKKNAQTALERHETTLEALQFERTKAVIAFRASKFKDDPGLQSKITAILWDMQDAGPKISKKFDLLDDALFTGALDLAGKEGEYTKKDLQGAITKVFPADKKSRKNDQENQPYSQGGTRPSESFGKMAEDGVNWALDWTGADAKSGWLGRTFNKLGDWGRAFGGFWGDLSTPWKAGIIGVAGFFGIGKFLKKQLGAFGNLPFVGLILGLIGFALTGKAAHAYMNRPKKGSVQGTNGFNPNPTEDSQKHGEKKATMGGVKTTGKFTVMKGQKVTDTREIETGMYAVQANTSGKKGFAPRNVVYLMTNDGIGDSALEDQAKTARHIPVGLKNVISAKDSAFDGITHDNRALRRTSANDFEYDAPAVA